MLKSIYAALVKINFSALINDATFGVISASLLYFGKDYEKI